MSYDEINELSRKSWDDEYNYLCVDRYKERETERERERNRGRYCIDIESKNTYLECTPETKPF